MKALDNSCTDMFKHRYTTNNQRYLIATLTATLEVILEGVGEGNGEAWLRLSESCVNLMFLARIFISYTMQRCGDEDRRRSLQFRRNELEDVKTTTTDIAIQIPGNNRNKGEATTTRTTRRTRITTSKLVEVEADNKLLNRLVTNITTLITTVQVTPSTAELHVEATNFAIVLASEQIYLFHESVEGSDIDSGCFLRLLSDPKSVAPVSLVKSLIGNITQSRSLQLQLTFDQKSKQNGAASRSNGEDSGPIYATLKSLVLLPFRLPLYMFRILFGSTDPTHSDLGCGKSSGLLLLVVMYHHQHGHVFRQALHEIHQQQESEYGIFDGLYDEITRYLSEEWAVLVLYALLSHNKPFKEEVYSKSDADVIVMPILKMLYSAKDLSHNRVYMGLIVLVILTSDKSFCDTLHNRLLIPSADWFKDHHLKDISLGSLTMIVLMRAMRENLYNHRDLSSFTNMIGILANMAPHAHALHPLAQKNLVDLVGLLSKRWESMRDGDVKQSAAAEDIDENNDHNHAQNNNVTADVDGNGNADVDTATQIEMMLTDFVRLSLEITCAFLHPKKLELFPELIYWLILQQNTTLKYLHHDDRLIDMVRPLMSLIDGFEASVEASVGEERDAEAVIDAIRTCATAKNLKSAGLNVVPAKFEYEEQKNCEDFFVPYIWNIIYQQEIDPCATASGERNESEEADFDLKTDVAKAPAMIDADLDVAPPPAAVNDHLRDISVAMNSHLR
eukprot:CAMPEP_0197515824 /NCGR_PEP_ID=MMETSP1318-20131121/823_1 /TAXON_ID=552666 /ORGANISM="Partenskyella glossopodia, Strain RCC365" /LENGTH=730 /DNA_ID=CAMNT_0043064287 /DNA_START=338 /DNA_END=2527 /DNA_ORIENTATION=-